MASRTVALYVVPGTPHHVWCDGCLTSARIRVPLYLLQPAGVTHISTWTGCPRCEEE